MDLSVQKTLFDHEGHEVHEEKRTLAIGMFSVKTIYLQMAQFILRVRNLPAYPEALSILGGRPKGALRGL